MLNGLRKFPVLTAFVALVVAGFAVHALIGVLPALELPAWGWWLAHGAVAALIGWLLKLPRWWLPLVLLAPTAFALLLLSGAPPWVSLLALVVLLLLYGGGVRTRVPLYLSNRAACEELVRLVEHLPSPLALDLGAGFGGPMRALARRFPNGRFVSVEASPATWLVAWLLALPARNVRVAWADLWLADITDADLVYVFLSPEPMPELWLHFCATAKPGALLVSNTFAVPGIDAQSVIELPGRADARLFVYRR